MAGFSSLTIRHWDTADAEAGYDATGLDNLNGTHADYALAVYINNGIPHLVLTKTRKLGIGTIAPNTLVDINGDFAIRWYDLSLSDGTSHNVNTSDRSAIRILSFTTTKTITGFTNGYDGRELTIYNPTGVSVILTNEDSGSTAGNRIKTLSGADVTIPGESVFRLKYDNDQERWIYMGSGGGSTDLSGAIITNPAAFLRNFIQAGTGAIGLAVKGDSSGTDIFRALDGPSSTLQVGIDSTGLLKLWQGLSIPTTVGAILLNGSAGTNGFVMRSNGSSATPSWDDPDSLVDLSGVVLLTPNSATRNRIIPGATTYPNLILKNISSQTAPQIESRSSGDALQSFLTSLGYWQINDATGLSSCSLFVKQGTKYAVVVKSRGSTGDPLMEFRSSADAVLSGVDNSGNLGVGITPDGGLTPKVHVYQSSLGSEVMRLESAATNDDPSVKTYQNRVTTTNNTFTTIHTVSCSTSGVIYRIKAEIIGHRTGGSGGAADDGVSFEIKGTFKNSGGTLTLIGVVELVAQKSNVNTNAQLSINTTDVRIQVKGDTNNNYTWHAFKIEVAQVGS